MQAGKLITFEGIDGSGKTTQLRQVEEYLTGAGYRVVTTREPGGTPLGLKIRAALLDGEAGSVDPLAELLLYAADRAQHVRQLVMPAIDAGMIVLCDRFFDATIAYQGYGRGFSLDMIRQLNLLATGGLTPHLTLVYDLDVEIGLTRTQSRQVAGSASNLGAPDRLDREPFDFHRRVREGYLSLVSESDSRFCVIPAQGTVGDVFKETLRHVRAVIEN